MSKLPFLPVLGSPVTTLSLTEVCLQIINWASHSESRTVCVADAHMLVRSYLSPEFNGVLQRSDIVTPDGMPLVVMLKLLGKLRQKRVAGMDIFLQLAHIASLTKTPVFFVGCTQEILAKIRDRLGIEYPDLPVAGMEALPFRPLTSTEDEALIDRIHQSDAGIVLVALGCPKQEIWMDQHRDRIHAVMVGVGGVFPVYAGELRRAPKWMQTICLEWAFRLLQEPHRLWQRYARVVPLFIGLSILQLLTIPFAYIQKLLQPSGRGVTQAIERKPVGLTKNR